MLRGATLAGVGAVGVGGAGVAAADTHGVIEDLIDEAANGGGSECDVVVDPNDGSNPDTISGGIDAASPGTRENLTTVCVAPGTYEESVTVDKDGIALVAQGNASNTEIRSDGTTVDVTGSDVLVFKFDIDATTGPAVDVGTRTGVRGCRITTNDTTGIVVDGEPTAVIHNEFEDFNGFGDSGIGVAAEGVRGEQDGENDGLFIAGNSFTDLRHGVELTDCKKVGIRSNTFDWCWYSAVQVDSLPGGPGVDLIGVFFNEFENNTNATIFYEGGDTQVTRVFVQMNDFDDFFWGVLTAPEKATTDFDNDGDEEEVEVAGPLDGGTVNARCNYWGRPTGPRAEENDLTVTSPVPDWVIPRGVRNSGVTPKRADKALEDAVEYRPWKLQPPTVQEVLPTWFPPAEWAIPTTTPDCVGGTGTERL